MSDTVLRQLKPTTLGDIAARVQEGQRLYDMLTDEERAEVDAFNAKIAGQSIRFILDQGEHPLVALRNKYKEKNP